MLEVLSCQGSSLHTDELVSRLAQQGGARIFAGGLILPGVFTGYIFKVSRLVQQGGASIAYIFSLKNPSSSNSPLSSDMFWVFWVLCHCFTNKTSPSQHVFPFLFVFLSQTLRETGLSASFGHSKACLRVSNGGFRQVSTDARSTTLGLMLKVKVSGLTFSVSQMLLQPTTWFSNSSVV